MTGRSQLRGLVAIAVLVIAAGLLLALIAARTAGADAGPAWPGVESSVLEAKLPTHEPVYCTQSDGSWAYADFPELGIYLAGWACDLLLHGDPGDTNARLQIPWAIAVHTLYHEWWHVTFHEHDEKLTDCGAWAIFPYVLERYWHLTAKQADGQYRLYGYGSHYAPLPCGFSS